ncbi:MAG: ATP-binding cassette domain-containing protein, partial [Lachnospiraceae bacterium]|nr:ATP-binding cassette domain-containing protein [Lachnospiraceae bacterium]
MSTGNILDFQHVSFAYKDGCPILTDLSFHIQRGEFVALIGSNGAGKSTISRLCNGLLKPTSGTVLLDGRDTSKVPVSKLASSCGFLFQNPDRQICE